MGKHNIVMSEFYCTQCGTKGLPVWRRRGNEREAGHLKKLYCLKCGRETNHAECKEYTHYQYHNFLEEYYGNNFTSDGLRKQPYGLFKNAFSSDDWEKLQYLISELDNGN